MDIVPLIYHICNYWMGYNIPENSLLFCDCQEALRFGQLFLGFYNNPRFVRPVSDDFILYVQNQDYF